MTRKKYVNFRVSKNEFLALSLMAKQEDRNQSEMLREVIREAANRRNICVGVLSDRTFEYTPNSNRP